MACFTQRGKLGSYEPAEIGRRVASVLENEGVQQVITKDTNKQPDARTHKRTNKQTNKQTTACRARPIGRTGREHKPPNGAQWAAASSRCG